jgi:UDP-N-acetylglucosamine 2-epimerase (non-hydrolysing)
LPAPNRDCKGADVFTGVFNRAGYALGQAASASGEVDEPDHRQASPEAVTGNNCKRMKILAILGTRPEAVKFAPVIHAAARQQGIEMQVCVTGQHRSLVDPVLKFFDIGVNHRLSVMRHNQDLSGLTTRVLEGVRGVLLADRPDLMLVHGDTATCFASALAAFYERVPVGHIEAGLRTHDLSSPFPEEGMRQMVSRLAAFHFAPTAANVATLEQEGIPAERIFLTGNTGIDAVLWARERIRRADPLASLETNKRSQIRSAKRRVLITSHRRENFGAGIRNICEAIATLAARHPATAWVFPVHPNPEVTHCAQSRLGTLANVALLPPLEYPQFVALMDQSYFLISDSGGVQEEAAALQKPVLVTRRTTERAEAVWGGHALLVGTAHDSIVNAVDRLLTSRVLYDRMCSGTCPFGDGAAANRILGIIAREAGPIGKSHLAATA